MRRTRSKKWQKPPATIPREHHRHPHDKAYELDQHLPLLLDQDYPAPFRIIVVFWRGESDTDDVLKKYAANPHLYATYIPDSSRYMSRKKLAITVGEKRRRQNGFS